MMSRVVQKSNFYSKCLLVLHNPINLVLGLVQISESFGLVNVYIFNGAHSIFYLMHHKILMNIIKGAVAHGNYFFPKKFEFVSLCSFICLQAVYQLSGPVYKATWNGCPSYSASYFHFTLCD